MATTQVSARPAYRYVWGESYINLFRRRKPNTGVDTCDIEPTGCVFAWLLLLISVVAHTMHYCGGDECETDDDEPNTMYS